MLKSMLAGITAAVFFALIISAACGANHTNLTPFPPQAAPTLRLSGLGGCDYNDGLNLASVRNDKLVCTVENGRVSFIHSNAVYNCCMDKVSFEMAVEGSVVRVVEKEHTSNPCLCVCAFTIHGEITDLAPGTYTVEICPDLTGKNPYCSAVVTVE
ncbi:MAG TPA: hypothetical protein VM123_16555 [archaeon]|nr:hypothetical protein [archaeon]